MKIIGIILILWGIADIGVSWMETELYGEIGIILPDWLTPYTPYVAILGGAGIYKAGKKQEKSIEEEV